MQARLSFGRHALGGAKALRDVLDYVAHCGLAPTLVDMVYLRVSQINGCAHCIDTHARHLRRQGVATEKVALIGTWREAGPLFTTRERAALAWAESLTRVPASRVPDADYACVARAFAPRELADLSMAIALMNAYNRVSIGLHVMPHQCSL